MRTIFLFVAILTAGAGAFAGEYVYRDGYYWQGGAAYTRHEHRVYTAPGCYYCRYSYAVAPVKVVEKVIEKVVEKDYGPPKPPKGWRESLLDAAVERDKHEQKLAADAVENKAYLDAVAAFGFNKGASPAAAPGYAYAYSTSAYGPNAAQGNTVYGYSLSSVSSVLGDNQVGVWMQQAGRAQAAAQATAEKGLDGLFGAIDLEGSNRARVAAILAKAEVLKSLDRDEVHTQARVEVTGQAPPPGLIPPPPGQGQGGNGGPGALAELFAARCGACHSQQGTIKGNSELFPQGVDLGQYSGFSYEQKKRVLETVLSGEMPKGGDPLSIEETGLIYADVLSAKQAARKE